MASCLPSRPLALAFSLLLILPLALGTKPATAPVLAYHGGDLLTGKIDLALMWYGRFGNSQKKVIRSFIKSLNYDGGANFEPQVSSWWQIVGSYQSFAGSKSKRSPGNGIKVQVVSQVSDPSFSLGKVVTVDFVKLLVQKATAGKPNTLAVIFTSRQVTASNLCLGKCSEHGVIGNTTFPSSFFFCHFYSKKSQINIFENFYQICKFFVWDNFLGTKIKCFLSSLRACLSMRLRGLKVRLILKKSV
jgi:hypothetical protein